MSKCLQCDSCEYTISLNDSDVDEWLHIYVREWHEDSTPLAMQGDYCCQKCFIDAIKISCSMRKIRPENFQ